MIHITGMVAEISVCDGEPVDQKAHLLRQIGDELRFPSYYGQNLDALSDCLSDLEWLPAATVTLVIREFRRLPRDLQGSLQEIFLEAEIAHTPQKLSVILFD